VIVGDGRLELEQAAKGSYDFLVLDAFTSDAIPTHLLTREAIRLELSRLSPHGVLAFHISNRFLNLEPVFAAAARDLHLSGLAQERRPTKAEKDQGALPSRWVILARHDADIAPLLRDRRWRRLAPTAQRAWTDDYSNVAGAFEWSS
jgi:spermidine synthase